MSALSVGILMEIASSHRHAISAAYRSPWNFFRYCMSRGSPIMELFSCLFLFTFGAELWIADAGLPYFYDDSVKSGPEMILLSVIPWTIGGVHLTALLLSLYRVRSICCLLMIVLAGALTGVDHYGNLPTPLIRAVFPPLWCCLAMCFWSLELERNNGRHS